VPTPKSRGLARRGGRGEGAGKVGKGSMEAGPLLSFRITCSWNDGSINLGSRWSENGSMEATNFRQRTTLKREAVAVQSDWRFAPANNRQGRRIPTASDAAPTRGQLPCNRRRQASPTESLSSVSKTKKETRGTGGNTVSTKGRDGIEGLRS